jgi:hypothetical protein
MPNSKNIKIFLVPYPKNQNSSPNFSALVLRFPKRYATSLYDKKLREEIDFEEMGHFGPGLYLGCQLI